MQKKPVKEHFEAHAEDWIASSYQGDGFTYPTAHHRARIVSRCLSEKKPPGSDGLLVADLGCGGGNLAIELAHQGHQVDGVDQAEKMIAIATQAKKNLPAERQDNITFTHGELEAHGLAEETYDAVVSMGVIGYLDDDDVLFRAARRLLKPGGVFILSCRNRLFNMNSLSFRTMNEIESGGAPALLEEISELYQPIPVEDSAAMVERLKKISDGLSGRPLDNETGQAGAGKDKSGPRSKPALEARQHTPRGIEKAAGKNAMTCRAFYGVHPHLIDPNVVGLLPPGVFNELSSCLESLEHLPVSLVWSSVFIGVLEKDT